MWGGGGVVWGGGGGVGGVVWSGRSGRESGSMLKRCERERPVIKGMEQRPLGDV